MCFFFFQAEDGIRDVAVTGVQTCALPISALDVGPRTEPRDATVHAEADGAVPERPDGALPDDDEAARAVREDGERVDRRGEPLALEAAPDEEEGPRVGGHTDLGTGGAPLGVPVPRVEPLEIHAVVDDRETLAGDAVEAGDLRGAAPGDRDDVRGRREHAPLELEHDAVEQGAASAGGADTLEVRAVAALPRPVDVLAERALVALHDVPAAAGDDDTRQRGEGEDADR